MLNGALPPLSYHRLGQAYPRRRTREPYPRFVRRKPAEVSATGPGVTILTGHAQGLRARMQPAEIRARALSAQIRARMQPPEHRARR